MRYAARNSTSSWAAKSTTPREFSEATAERIDATVRKLIDNCYREAEDLLRHHKSETELLARALLQHETLTAVEVETILKAGTIDAIVK